MSAFSIRGLAEEKMWIQSQERNSLQKHIERLIQAGNASDELLSRLQRKLAGVTTTASTATANLPAAFSEVPVELRNQRPASEQVYDWAKAGKPRVFQPEAGANLTVGTRVSLGRTRWNVHGASVFSVEDGKRLAQTPVKETSCAWEVARFNKIQRAAQQTPLVMGYRLLPELTPGRAFLWGSILALWGTMLTVKLAAHNLGIEKPEQAPDVLRQVVAPYADSLAQRLEPLRDMMALRTAAVDRQAVAESGLAKELRRKLGAGNRVTQS